MSFNLENGYTPRDIDAIISDFREAVNSEYGQKMTADQFKGSNWYKLIYAASQLVATAEGHTAELSNKMIDYIRKTNEDIQLVKSSVDGIMWHLKKDLDLVSSVKPTTADDAGYLYITVDIDKTAADYADKKQQILEKLKEYCTAGLFFNGAESGEVVASNGQPFIFGYDLPVIVDMQVRIKVTISDNTTAYIMNNQTIKEKFLENFNSMYKLGLDFEGDRYLCAREDLPFASKIVIEWRIGDSGNWSAEVWESAYNQKLNLTSVEVII